MMQHTDVISVHMHKPSYLFPITKNWNYIMPFSVISLAVKSVIPKALISELTSGFIRVKNLSCVLGKIVGGVSDDQMNSSATIEDILEKSRTYVLFVEDLLVVQITDLRI